MSTDPRESFNTNFTVLKRTIPQQIKFPIGITSFNIDRGANLRLRVEVKASPDDSSSYKINIPPWGDTRCRMASCNWLEVYETDRDFQFGQFNTNDDLNSPGHCPNVRQRITFPKMFSSQPCVVLWLNLLDFNKDRNLRVTAFATDITLAGFDIHIDSWSTTIMHAARVSWIAYPADRPNIRSGVLNIGCTPPSKSPSELNVNHLTFDCPFPGSRPPRVVAGFCMLDIGNEAEATAAVEIKDVNVTGMTWAMGCWGKTFFYGGRAMYIAIQDL